METCIDWLHNGHEDWLGTRHDWSGLCPTIPNLGYATVTMGNDINLNRVWEKLYKFGILHESLLQCMLDKFHSDYPAALKLTKQQVVDILLCFHLLACITKEVVTEEAKIWFTEEGYKSLPAHGDTFIVPCLLLQDNSKTCKSKNIPNTKQERIVYYNFSSGFVPSSLLHHLIADCICRNVKQNNRLPW